ncbi:MAG: hypothetical protein QM784_01925 [Polyangiaceae bacterium]
MQLRVDFEHGRCRARISIIEGVGDLIDGALRVEDLFGIRQLATLEIELDFDVADLRFNSPKAREAHRWREGSTEANARTQLAS